MIKLLISSHIFKGMCSTLWDVLLFREQRYKWFSVFMWLVFPLIPAIILGWYIGDLFTKYWSTL